MGGALWHYEGRLLWDDIGCLQSLRSLLDFVSDFLTFGQRLKATALDRTEVSEYIGTTVILSDEAETFGVVKPFNCSCCHDHVPFITKLK